MEKEENCVIILKKNENKNTLKDQCVATAHDVFFHIRCVLLTDLVASISVHHRQFFNGLVVYIQSKVDKVVYFRPNCFSILLKTASLHFTNAPVSTLLNALV